MTTEILAQDVKDVAERLNINLSDEQINEVLEMYDAEADNDPTATWDLIVENCIYTL